MVPTNEISLLLESLSAPTRSADAAHTTQRLFVLVYHELHKLATNRLKRESPGNTLQPTALVHEVFLRLVSPNLQSQWENTGHFFGAASQAMRRILIDNARKKLSQKRGGNRVKLVLDLQGLTPTIDDLSLIELNDALTDLAKVDPIKAQLVELRFFGGLSLDEVSAILGISRATAHRYWNSARAWLYIRVSDSNELP